MTSVSVGWVVPRRGDCPAVHGGVQAGALRVAIGQPGHRLRAAGAGHGREAATRLVSKPLRAVHCRRLGPRGGLVGCRQRNRPQLGAGGGCSRGGTRRSGSARTRGWTGRSRPRRQGPRRWGTGRGRRRSRRAASRRATVPERGRLVNTGASRCAARAPAMLYSSAVIRSRSPVSSATSCRVMTSPASAAGPLGNPGGAERRWSSSCCGVRGFAPL